MKKRLTLNKSWMFCLAQWKWIIQQIRNGNELSINELKRLWMKIYGFQDDELQSNCFFCYYDEQYKDDCLACPGKKVDESFYCWNPAYAYDRKPEKFRKELLRLNRKRNQ